jgi:hypothetical protein
MPAGLSSDQTIVIESMFMLISTDMRTTRTSIVNTLLAVLAGLGFALLAAFLWRTAGATDTSHYGTTFNPPSYSSPAAATSTYPATSNPAPQPSPTASTEPEDGSDDGGGGGDG